MQRPGIIELDTRDFSIVSIGRDKLSPARWVAENETRYQRAFADAIADGEKRYDGGSLRYPIEMPRQLQIGLFAHFRAQAELATYNRGVNVPEGPGQLISMNRWTYDRDMPGQYIRVDVDVLLDLGVRPNERFIIDGKSSATEALRSAGQFNDASRILNTPNVKAATPQGMIDMRPKGRR